MERRNTAEYDPVAAAAKLNTTFANHLKRDKRTGLWTTLGLGALGIAVLFSKYTIVLSPPCWIAAFIAFLFYCDSRAQLREVLSRRDASPTPRVSDFGKRPRRPPPADAPAALPRV